MPAFIAIVAGAGLVFGLSARRWWAVGVACLPSLAWLVLTVPEWGSEDSDGVTGADFFVAGLLYLGLPVVVGVVVGVLIGRRLFPPSWAIARRQ